MLAASYNIRKKPLNSGNILEEGKIDKQNRWSYWMMGMLLSQIKHIHHGGNTDIMFEEKRSAMNLSC